VFRFTCRKAFSARSIALRMVDNQRSGVTVVEVRISLGLKPRSRILSLHQSKLSYLSEDRTLSTSSGIKAPSCPLDISLFFPLDWIYFCFTYSPKKTKKKTTLSHILYPTALCALQYFNFSLRPSLVMSSCLSSLGLVPGLVASVRLISNFFFSPSKSSFVCMS
jgi:hypothetical protein